MATRNLRLIYPPSLLRQPIIHQLIQTFDLTINILQAEITLESGWIEIEAEGDLEEINRAEAWLRQAGLQVEPKT